MADLGAHPPVPIYKLFLKMGGWIVLLVGLLVLSLSMVSSSDAQMAERFRADGRPAEARIARKWVTKSRNPDGSLSTVYWMTLKFETRGGEDIVLERMVGRSEYRRSGEGGRLDLLYLADDPKKVELTPNWYRSAAGQKQMVALGLGVIWLVLLWVVGRWSVEAVRAREYGTREEAMVLDVRRGLPQLGGRPGFRLIWRDARGREGRSLLRNRADLMRFTYGDKVVIYQGVGRSWWVGDVGERPADSE